MIDASDEYYFFGNGAWRLGEHCTLTTQIRTNGRTTQWNDDIVIGSTHAIVLDVGGITENQFMDSVKAAECVKECNIPILIIHGTGDTFVPHEMSVR